MDSMAIVLTGAPGAGKSSVLEKLATLLEIDGIAFGALESEQLSWGSPSLHGEPWLAQLKAVMELQRDAGRRLFLIAVTAETTDELAAVRAAVGTRRIVTVLLSAPAEVVAARITTREPDTWPGKQPLIEHARQLAVSMQDLDDVDIRLETTGREPADVAAELHRALRAFGLTL